MKEIMRFFIAELNFTYLNMNPPRFVCHVLVLTLAILYFVT